MLTKQIKFYEDREDVSLTIYVIGEKGELSNVGKRPAVIICPGGAYIGCSDREAEPVALKYNAMGYQAFVLRYSTYMEGKLEFPNVTSTLEPKEHCQHPTPVREIGKAMLMIRENAEDWFVDTDKIIICGFSAGAHNAAMYTTYWHTPLLTEYFGVDKEMLRPAAAILGYTLSDYIFMKENINQDNQEIFKLSNLSYLGDINPPMEKLHEVSPARNVTKLNPPTFLWATAADTLVSVQHSLCMAHALADHKVPFEMHIFEEGAHGLSIATQASSVSQSQVNVDVTKWIDLVEKWLEKRFMLNLKK